MQLQLQDGQRITIDAKPFAGGGEGDLHRVLQPSHYRHYVVKLYKKEKRTPEREQKLLYLQSHPPQGVHFGGGHATLVWVKDVVYANGVFAGFSMPYTMGEKLDLLCSLKIPKRMLQAWQRFERQDGRELELRLKVCYNIAAAVYQVHESGHYVLVDLKPENILIQPNGLVSIVDMDSIEVLDDEGQLLYPSSVNTPEFTPPEYYLHGRKENEAFQQSWDRFALSVIFYKILLGIHPYSANNHKPPYHQFNTIEDMIRHGLFVHGSKKPYLGMVPPPHGAFHLLDRDIRKLFLRCFEEGGNAPGARPTANEWCRTLATLIQAPVPDEMFIRSFGTKEKELQPGEAAELYWEMDEAAFIWLEGIGLVEKDQTATVYPLPGQIYTLEVYDLQGHRYEKTFAPRFITGKRSAQHPPHFSGTRRRRWALTAAAVMAALLTLGFFLGWGAREGSYSAAFFVLAFVSAYSARRYILKGYYESEALKRKKELMAEAEEVRNRIPGTETIQAGQTELQELNHEAGARIQAFLQAREQLGSETQQVISRLPLQQELETVRTSLREVNAGTMDLQQKEDAALRKAIEDARLEYMQQYMVTYGLQHQQIPGISRNDVERLMEVGIFSAADFRAIRSSSGDIILKNGKKVHARGVGPKKAKALMAWRERVLQHLNSRISDIQPKPELITSIRKKYAGKKEKLRQEFRELAAREDDLKKRLRQETDRIHLEENKKALLLWEAAKKKIREMQYRERAAPLREQALHAKARQATQKGRLLLVEKELEKYRDVSLKKYLLG